MDNELKKSSEIDESLNDINEEILNGCKHFSHLVSELSNMRE